MNSNAVRGGIAALLLIVGLLVGWFGHKGLMSPPDLATISVYDDWRLACPQLSQKDGSCEIQQDVLDAKTHTELARLSIFNVKADKNLLITVPFNVLLEPGVGIKIGDGKPTFYPFESCNGVGCMVRVAFKDDIAKTFKDAAAGNKQIQLVIAGLDGKFVGLPFSLKGYQGGIAAFDSNDSKRHSWWSRLWS
ncbi:MAG: invasion associated locus B family protein [Alphaproteobacteria bacterium]|nr:invasion associated locus B family protein [Alphaproteobacteria bacterium]